MAEDYWLILKLKFLFYNLLIQKFIMMCNVNYYMNLHHDMPMLYHNHISKVLIII